MTVAPDRRDAQPAPREVLRLADGYAHPVAYDREALAARTAVERAEESEAAAKRDLRERNHAVRALWKAVARTDPAAKPSPKLLGELTGLGSSSVRAIVRDLSDEWTPPAAHKRRG